MEGVELRLGMLLKAANGGHVILVRSCWSYFSRDHLWEYYDLDKERMDQRLEWFIQERFKEVA